MGGLLPVPFADLPDLPAAAAELEPLVIDLSDRPTLTPRRRGTGRTYFIRVTAEGIHHYRRDDGETAGPVVPVEPQEIARAIHAAGQGDGWTTLCLLLYGRVDRLGRHRRRRHPPRPCSGPGSSGPSGASGGFLTRPGGDRQRQTVRSLTTSTRSGPRSRTPQSAWPKRSRGSGRCGRSTRSG